MFNTTERFGWVAVGIHWVMALSILGLFGLGWYMVDLTYYDDLYKTLPFIHKSIGIILALVFVFRIVWSLTNAAPQAVPGTRFEHLAAKAVHYVFYVGISLILASGYLISTADGSSISVFDIFNVPASVTSLPEQEDNAGLVHEYLAYTVIAFVLLHAAAALKHHFFDRDNTLRRMTGMRLVDEKNSNNNH